MLETQRVESLKGIPLFQGLEPIQLERLANAGVERDADKGETLFLEGGEASGFYVVLQGMVKIFRTSPDGRETVLHLYGPGNIFGEVPVLAGGRFPATAMAVEKSRVLYLERQRLVAVLRQDATLAMNMLASLSRKLREFAVKIEALNVQELDQRLAAYLLDASEREDSDTLRLDVTKGLLASFLGASREALSRTLSRLADQGRIEVKGRSIRLKDKEGLAELVRGMKKPN
jgi:CRP/FNR family transcriptional regulator